MGQLISISGNRIWRIRRIWRTLAGLPQNWTRACVQFISESSYHSGNSKLCIFNYICFGLSYESCVEIGIGIASSRGKSHWDRYRDRDSLPYLPLKLAAVAVGQQSEWNPQIVRRVPEFKDLSSWAMKSRVGEVAVEGRARTLAQKLRCGPGSERQADWNERDKDSPSDLQTGHQSMIYINTHWTKSIFQLMVKAMHSIIIYEPRNQYKKLSIHFYKGKISEVICFKIITYIS